MDFETPLLTAVLGSMTEGVAVADESGRLIYFNRSAERTLGLGASSSTSDRWPGEYGVFLPDRVTPYPDDRLPLARALAGEVVENDLQFIRNPQAPDGIWLRVNAAPIHTDGSRGAVAVFRDVTVQYLHERRVTSLANVMAVISQRLDLQSVLTVAVAEVARVLEAPLAVVLVPEEADAGDTLRIDAASPGAAELAQACGLSIGSRLRFGNRGWQDVTRASAVVQEGGLASCATTLITSASVPAGLLVVGDREQRVFGENARWVLDQVAVGLGIAMRNAGLFRELRSANERLRNSHTTALEHERLRIMGQLASGIAHDLNNTLSPVLALSEVIREGLAPPSKLNRYLETISRAANDAVAVVGRLREFYRKPDKWELKPVDLNQVVWDVLDLTSPKWAADARKRGREIHVKTDLTPLPKFPGNPSELREAVTNVVLNAADAMPDGGTLTVRTSQEGTGTTTGPTIARVDVVDTGIGMDDATKQSMFEPYFTTKAHGTGIGMSGVEGAVLRHGGTVRVESRLGEGTTVSLLLPTDDHATDSGFSCGRASSSGLYSRMMKVLCVEDDPLARDVLCELLELMGHTWLIAESGQEGIRLFNEHEDLDVVITDLGMPGGNGDFVAEHVKSVRPEVPVVLLTGWGQQLLDEGTMPPNVDAVLPKPLRPGDLREALASIRRGPRTSYP